MSEVSLVFRCEPMTPLPLPAFEDPGGLMIAGVRQEAVLHQSRVCFEI